MGQDLFSKIRLLQDLLQINMGAEQQADLRRRIHLVAQAQQAPQALQQVVVFPVGAVKQLMHGAVKRRRGDGDRLDTRLQERLEVNFVEQDPV